MRRFALVAVFALGSVAGYAGEAPEERTEQTEPPADEQSSDRERDPKDEPTKRSQVSLEDATAIVRQAYGGRVVSAAAATARPQRARPKESGYRVRVDVDGRVKTVFVDARGRIHENAEY
ncbi:MAG: PepSY domain-containing protein [Gammaproteobacteria bacterium]|nr:PepSY domain-containing protein [Gammaproteobacteria bacterium]MDE0444844.1 PepSY domain-containing protein [Gammaproteobacteria bacterium]